MFLLVTAKVKPTSSELYLTKKLFKLKLQFFFFRHNFCVYVCIQNTMLV